MEKSVVSINQHENLRKRTVGMDYVPCYFTNHSSFCILKCCLFECYLLTHFHSLHVYDHVEINSEMNGTLQIRRARWAM